MVIIQDFKPQLLSHYSGKWIDQKDHLQHFLILLQNKQESFNMKIKKSKWICHLRFFADDEIYFCQQMKRWDSHTKEIFSKIFLHYVVMKQLLLVSSENEVKLNY